MAAVSVAEEVLAGVLQAAEHLKGSVVAAEAGPLESLRWAGALPLLLRDLRVPRVVAADALLACETRAQVRHLLLPRPWEGGEVGEEEEEDDDGQVVVERLALLVSGFLWDYEPALRRLLSTGAIARLTVCSSLSERAHECFDFVKAGGPVVPSGAKAASAMAFGAFAAALNAHHGGAKRVEGANRAVASPRQEKNSRAAEAPRPVTDDGDDGDDWDWTDDNGHNDAEGGLQTHKPPQADPWTPSSPKFPTALPPSASSVRVVHLPLNVAPLLSNKTPSAEPSLFVLSHPVCASAFPLMLHQAQTGQVVGSVVPSSALSSTPGGDELSKRYTHVKDVLPEHIPDAFRRSLRLLAHVLGELLTHARLDVKERIFALGATSLKIGHTLVSPPSIPCRPLASNPSCCTLDSCAF